MQRLGRGIAFRHRNLPEMSRPRPRNSRTKLSFRPNTDGNRLLELPGKRRDNQKQMQDLRRRGRVRKTARVKVKIPAGIDDGQGLKLSGYGEAGAKGGTPGDLYINISVQPHEIFERDGLDIYMEMPITFSQAALGATVSVPTLTGPVKLKIPAGTQTGTKFKLSRKGIASSRAGTTGNQYVLVKVVTPTHLSAEQKELFNRLSKTNEKPASFFEKIKKFFS